jgi:uncharacterized protein (DUF169 family)
MSDYRDLDTRISKGLGLKNRPVAVKFMAKPPAQVAKFEGAEPSSCAYWRLAAGGRTFYTVASDHYNCAVVGYTHNVSLPPEPRDGAASDAFLHDRARLHPDGRSAGNSALGRNARRGHLFTTRRRAPRSGRRHLRGARGANHVSPASRSERRARVAISDAREVHAHGAPASLANGTAMSSGCIANRAYTDLGEGELYAVVRGRDLGAIADKLKEIATANAKLSEYHRSRRQEISTQ